ncbi:hypothetical protein RHMOL_Rhmol07G0248300 [Rhododendron molle]|uniref:Uncharacterized protein n=1 Tax=Rhododendron molle TaxID=49168 RepID=A0ACC0N4M6_RHOML|nr:hypothetical protein RHMOL_Rhmol07G0248300 [Rhododendron molle]
MSLLDQLWDDTIAGPRPDKGLGKLRKQPTFTLRALSSGKESDGGSVEEGVRVTRSIMIVKPTGVTQNDSPPVSPAGSTPPVSPFSGTRLSLLSLLLDVRCGFQEKSAEASFVVLIGLLRA